MPLSKWKQTLAGTPEQNSPLTLVFTQGLRRLSPPMDQAPVKFHSWILQFTEKVCFLAKTHPCIFWGCVRSLLLHGCFLLRRARAALQLQRLGCSFQQLLSLQRSMGSRHADFSSCSSWAPGHRLNSCVAQAQVLLST